MKKIIDLTYDIEEGMLTFNTPWHPVLSVKKLGRHFLEGRETREIIIGTHTGTHLDAPLHFVPNGGTIDKVNLDLLIGDVSIIDFSNLKPNTEITKKMLENLKLKKRVIFKFGWGKYWNDKKFYSNYPFFSEEALKYLISKGVGLIGLDTPSPDDGRTQLTKDMLGTEKDSPMHKILLSNDVLILEYLANLDQVKDYEDWTIAIMPMKIKGGDGAPARVVIYK